MSLAERGHYIFCDGDNCTAHTCIPVALRPMLGDSGRSPRAAGWLFLLKDNHEMHYCPVCAKIQLNRSDFDRSKL